MSLLNPALNTGDAAGDTYTNIHRIQGSNFGDTLTGDNAGDVINGYAGNDTIIGGTGADYLYGVTGNDTLKGGGGTNYLDGGAGADSLDGTGGTSYASYQTATSGVTVNLLNPALNTGDAAGDSYLNIHNVQGSNYADTLTGDNAGDILYGLGGSDMLVGGTGTDILYGGIGADTLVGGGGTNNLYGGAGADSLDGTGGTSYATYLDSTAGLTVSLLNPALNTGDAAGDTYTNIHRIQGSNFGDTLTGDNAGDILYGLGGSDMLVGGTGTDILYGGIGADTLVGGGGTNNLYGGAGADSLDGTGGTSYATYLDSTAGLTVSLLNPALNTGDAAGDTYTNIHRIQGSNFGDTLTGDNAGDVINGYAGNDTIIGGTGADYLYGVTGNDTLKGGGGTNYLDGGAGADSLDGTGGTSYASYQTATSGVTVNLLNPALNTGDAAGDSYLNIHNVQGSNYADTITADNAGDVLYGLGGADTLVGGTGADVLYGGLGTDTLTGGAGADRFVFGGVNDGPKTIADFATTEGDKLQVTSSGFGGVLQPNTYLNPSQFVDGSAPTAAAAQFLWNVNDHTLSFDQDGTGAASSILIASFAANTNLTAQDIFIA